MVYDLFNIEGRKAMVTGGSRGLGHSMAEALLEAGCEVAIVGASDGVFAAAEKFNAAGHKAHPVKADLSVREQAYESFDKCLAALGGDIDILVTAAGVNRRRIAEDYAIEDWDFLMNVNLTSVFIQCQLAARVMLKKGYGKIINLSSMVAHFGGQTVPAYTASKGGVTQLTRELSNDWLGRGINVNAIAPGYMATDMCAALVDDPVRGKQILERIPAGRWGKGDDLKGVVVFLASHASDYMGGAIVPVDGGYLVK